MSFNEVLVMNIKKHFQVPKSQNKAILLATLMTILVGITDTISGYEMGFFVFYYIPIIYSAWNLGKRKTILFSIFAAVVWYLSDFYTDHTYTSEFFRYWNSSIRLMSFLLIGILFSDFRIKLDKEKKLNSDLTKAITEIKQLRGLLPICASCKSIRNDRGSWEQIEKYVKDHSDANFSHSICPSCMEKLYPSVIQKRKDKLAAADKNETTE
jgi:hypothetical protein